MDVNVGGDKVHKPTLHTKDFNVEGDKIHKPTPTQETHDENDEFQSQNNINEFQDPIAKHYGMPKATSSVDLYKNIELLLGNTCQTPKTNLVNNPTTPTNGNIGIKQNHDNV
jgi:hypothetical protein